MTVRKRTDLRLLNDLLSPISEPWNDVFQTQEKPVNALFSGIYGLLVDGKVERKRCNCLQCSIQPFPYEILRKLYIGLVFFVFL